jgi:hypothetical protein
VTGSGLVTFYGAFTVNEPITKLSTLTVNENISVVIPENLSDDIVLYPVPVKDKLSFSLDNDTELLLVTIIDINGQEVFSKRLSSIRSSFTINAEELSAGIYFLQVKTPKSYYAKKFVKE